MTATLVVVTGGSSGLGRSLLQAAPPRARLVDVSRSGPAELGRPVDHVRCDLADPAGWDEVAAQVDGLVADDWRRVVLWHAAGTLEPIGFAGEVDHALYRRNVLLNAAAGQVIGERFLAAVRGLPTVRRELVMISSGAASKAYPGWSAYGAGKAALDHWTRAVHAEQARRGGVRVVSVAPGVVATPMQERIRATGAEDFPGVERFRGLHRDGALEDPHDVARRLWDLLEQADLPPVVDLRDHR
jgi:benzil reductase ((S)-benzoin forming)